MTTTDSEIFGMPVNITRCSNNYGAYQFPEKLIPLIINNCLNGKDLPVYGDGMQVRDWLHVSASIRNTIEHIVNYYIESDTPKNEQFDYIIVNNRCVIVNSKSDYKK